MRTVVNFQSHRPGRPAHLFMNLSDIHKVELKEEYFKRPKALLAANKKSIENQKVFQKRKQLENSFAYFQSLYWWYFVRGVSNVSSRSKWYQSQGHGLFLHIPNSHCSYVTSMSHLPSKSPQIFGVENDDGHIHYLGHVL